MKALKLILKIIIVLILLIYFIYLILIALIDIDKDTCLDSSICKEGLEINTEYGLVKINKENCLKYNWIWNDKKKSCNLNK